MARRRFLITYDIADDKRRTAVFNTCYAQGDHTQYSVFMAELDEQECIALRGELDAIIHHTEDQVLFADLGPADRDTGRIIAALGKPYDPPTRALVV